MKINTKFAFLFTFLALQQLNPAQADQTIINNNGGGQSQDQAPVVSGCENNAPPGLPPGHYVKQNADGSTDQVYTTGTKQPYIVDPNCGQQVQPIIQPFISPNMPGPEPMPLRR
ncbi:MAG: hypothetical protein WA253_00980 [Gammaproteobacteria bacterium]